MKKVAVILSLVFLASLPVFGSGIKLQFGPAITSINYSEESSIPSWISKNSLFQLTGGVGFELSFNTNLALEVDVMYAPGGVEYKGTIMGSTITDTFKGYAVSVPILLKLSFMPGTTPYIIAGGVLAYTTSQTQIIDETGAYTYHDEIDETSEVNRFQYGLVFGGGVEIAIASMNFLIEGRYCLGLSNLIKNPMPSTESAKPNNILILVGYKF